MREEVQSVRLTRRDVHINTWGELLSRAISWLCGKCFPNVDHIKSLPIPNIISSFFFYCVCSTPVTNFNLHRLSAANFVQMTWKHDLIGGGEKIPAVHHPKQVLGWFISHQRFVQHFLFDVNWQIILFSCFFKYAGNGKCCFQGFYWERRIICSKCSFKKVASIRSQDYFKIQIETTDCTRNYIRMEEIEEKNSVQFSRLRVIFFISDWIFVILFQNNGFA